MEDSSIVYSYGDGIYLNITNRCSNRCSFCVRTAVRGLGDADCLWLEREPTVAEVIAELRQWPLQDCGEVIFCGYGEPTERLDAVLELSEWLHGQGVRTRLNTNGQADLINGSPTCPRLAGKLDAVSVSLNQCTAEKYQALCHSRYGLDAFPAVLRFLEEVRQYVPDVTASVVSVIDEADLDACRRIAKAAGVRFRVR
ncbi:MAG: TatD family nuclease-associated radical SAM protein [Anaerovoracaceae bacterium]|jgi:TatD family-associated radical SAM protein